MAAVILVCGLVLAWVGPRLAADAMASGNGGVLSLQVYNLVRNQFGSVIVPPATAHDHALKVGLCPVPTDEVRGIC
jgi:hypothetical protein